MLRTGGYGREWSQAPKGLALLQASSKRPVPDNRRVRDWDAPRALGDRMRRSNRQALPCGSLQPSPVIFQHTWSRLRPESRYLPSYTAFRWRKLSKFVNLTKGFFTNAILSFLGAIYKQEERSEA